MEDSTNNTPTASTSKTPKVKWVKRIFKTLLWIIIGIILLILLILGGISLFLSPEKLTKTVEKYATEYIDGEVNIGKVELTIWKTLPQIRIDVDSLEVISNKLKDVSPDTRAKLPHNADTLLFLKHFHGGLNVSSLIAGKIELYDIVIQSPMVNLVVADSLTANYDILPPSTPEATDTTSTMPIPDISIDCFTITDALPITYFSLPDSIDAGITFGKTYIDGNGAPRYDVAINGDIKALLPPLIKENNLPIGLNGKIDWSPQTPYSITLNDFSVDVAELHSTVNTSIDCNDSLVVNSFDINIKPTPISALLSHVPEQYSAELKDIKTNLTVSANAQLLSPYTVKDSIIPSLDITIDVPKGKLTYKKRYSLKEFTTSLLFHIDGKKLNSSSATIKSLSIDGMGVTADLNGTIKSPMINPLVNGKFNGSINFDLLPQFIKKTLPGTITGRLTANTSVKLRQNDLTRTNFHRAKLSGSATLHDFSLDIPDSSTYLYTRETTFRFGTSNSFVANQHKVDSLLTASLKIDTMLVKYDGMRVMMKNAKAGVGCKNIASSIDSTQINPIGATIRAERINFRDADSSRIRLRDVMCRASLQRYNKNAKVPKLNLAIEARRISYGDKLNRLSLRESNMKITAHLRERRKMGKRMQARYDSIAKLHPDLAPDSIYRIAVKSRKRPNRSNANIKSDTEVLDFDLDNSTKQLLRRWNVHGTITAKRGRLFTPYFPLRNTLSNINVDFTTDSILLNDIKYTVGQSDFLINGAIKNIRQSLTTRRKKPIEINFRVNSDTININEIAQTAFTGAAFAEKANSQDLSIAHIENEDSIQMVIEQQTTEGESAALLIPTNIEATVNLRAKNVYYADLLLKRFRGNLLVMNGALNLHRLSAKTDVGDIRMSALYTAPTKKEMKFGFGLEIEDLQIDKVINMIPAVDSLMPLLKDFEGIIDADIAATTDVDSAMNIVIPSLNAAIKLHGDSLVLLDAETFKTLSKWLMFKNKKRNMIDQMTVEMLVENSTLELFPFMFDIDRYRLGIMGQNDMALNLNYHISVLKSPLPFKFGINVSGSADDMKIRVGKAKYNEKSSGQRIAIVDTTRINLMNQIENVFRRGVNVAKLGKLNVNRENRIRQNTNTDIAADTISHADSLMLIKEGILPALPQTETDKTTESDNKKSKKKNRNR